MGRQVSELITEIDNQYRGYKFNLSNNSHYQLVRDIADEFLKLEFDFRQIQQGLPDKVGLFTGLGIYLAISKRLLQQHQSKKFNLGILFNLVHEHNRLRPASKDNPNGEDSLRNKIKQIRWLFEGSNIGYKLVYISGSDEWGSEQIIEKIIREEGVSDLVKLYKITDYDIGNNYTRNWKGGEVHFGMNIIAGSKGYPYLEEFDLMLFTDADMSLDLGQMGIALQELFLGADFVMGDRSDPKSLLVKNLKRSGKGAYFYRHIQRRLAADIFDRLGTKDTQCPWKLLSKSTLVKILEDFDTQNYGWDTDVIGSAIKHNLKIKLVPVTFIDSSKETHQLATGAANRLYPLVKSMGEQMIKYGFDYDQGIKNLFDKYITSTDAFDKVLNSEIPVEYQSFPERRFGEKDFIPLEELEEWLKSL